MQPGQTVVVRRGGFFTAVARGAIGLVITVVVCGSVLGLYGLNIADRKGDRLLSIAESVGENLPDWQAALPPALADALSDRRDVGYREKLAVTTKVKIDRNDKSSGDRDRRRDHGRDWDFDDGDDTRVIVEITNNGDQIVSLLAMRVMLLDEDGDAVGDWAAYGATPLALEDRAWRGPLQPGATRVIVERPRHSRGAVSAKVDVSELRVWDPKIAEQVRNDAKERRAKLAADAAEARNHAAQNRAPARGRERDRDREQNERAGTVRAEKSADADERE